MQAVDREPAEALRKLDQSEVVYINQIGNTDRLIRSKRPGYPLRLPSRAPLTPLMPLETLTRLPKKQHTRHAAKNYSGHMIQCYVAVGDNSLIEPPVLYYVT